MKSWKKNHKYKIHQLRNHFNNKIDKDIPEHKRYWRAQPEYKMSDLMYYIRSRNCQTNWHFMNFDFERKNQRTIMKPRRNSM